MSEIEYPLPSNLYDCFSVLTEIFNEPDSDSEWFKNASEEEVVNGSHNGLGVWIRSNWGLWSRDTEFYTYFKNLGLWHADDMSSVILTSYHRFLNKKDLDIVGQIDYHINYWNEYEKLNGPVEKN